MYPFVENMVGEDKAGKITGMLLDLHDYDWLNSLVARIDEALQLLAQPEASSLSE